MNWVQIILNLIASLCSSAVVLYTQTGSWKTAALGAAAAAATNQLGLHQDTPAQNGGK